MIALLALLLAPAPAVDLVGAAGTIDAPLLVGSRGEIYERSTPAPAPATYARRAGGGVSTRLVSVGGSATPWAVGDKLPAFAYAPATGWTALPLRLGGVIELADGPLLAVASGRKLAVRAAKDWQQLNAPGDVAGLWAAAPKDLIAVTRTGEAHRLAGKWKPLKLAGGKPEKWADVLDAGGVPLLLSATGTLARVDAKGPRRLERPPTWSSARVRLAAHGAPVVLAELPGTPVTFRLGRVDAARVVDLGPLPAIDAPIAVLAAPDGRALIVTRGGTVHTRDAAGAWATSTVDSGPPTTTGPKNPPALAPR